MKHAFRPFLAARPVPTRLQILSGKRGHKGETLIEALVTVLIVALSASALATSVVVSQRMTFAASAKSEQLYAAQTAAAENATDHSGTVTVQVSGANVPEGEISFSVSYTGQERMTAYFLNEGSAP